MFKILCFQENDVPLAGNDYLQLAQVFHTMLIHNVPQLILRMKSPMRRNKSSGLADDQRVLMDDLKISLGSKEAKQSLLGEMGKAPLRKMQHFYLCSNFSVNYNCTKPAGGGTISTPPTAPISVSSPILSLRRIGGVLALKCTVLLLLDVSLLLSSSKVTEI
uniref:Uncharacterized protein n=1 Tax=Glossina pallidipes TaxID=7398 RepID=A0A1A9ZAG9_GLOPL